MKKSRKVALGGLFAAANVALVWTLSLFPGIGIVGAMVAGFLLAILCGVAGNAPAWGAFISAATLLVLLSAKKMPAGAYACLFGYYPILFVALEKLKSFLLRLIVKLFIFEGVLAAVLVLGTSVIKIDLHGVVAFKTGMSMRGSLFFAAVLILYNIMILAYEFFLRLYYAKWHDSLCGRFRHLVGRP